MKEKLLPFIVGLLVGALLATIGFFIYSKTKSPIRDFNGRRGGPPEMTNGENKYEKPDGERETQSSSSDTTESTE